MISNFRSRGLQQAFGGNTRRLNPALAPKILGVLVTLNAAHAMGDLDVLSGLHPLTGNRAGTYAVKITGNWRITFVPVVPGSKNPLTNQITQVFHVADVDFEDYH